MADQEFLEILSQCIDRLAQGQTVNDCLQSYPEYAAQLRPMLETQAILRRAQPSTMEIARAREQVRTRLQNRTLHQRRTPWAMRLMRIAAVLIFVLAASAMVLAQSALPGDALYGAKRASEQVAARFSADPAAAAQQLDQRRIDEIHQLLGLKRPAEVAFDGKVQAINGTNWRIGDLPVRVDQALTGVSDITLGALVNVQGETTLEGTLRAKTVRVLTAGLPSATPSLMPTATFTQTLTQTPTQTQSPTPTLTAPATETATLTVTMTAMPAQPTTPLRTITPAATATLAASTRMMPTPVPTRLRVTRAAPTNSTAQPVAPTAQNNSSAGTNSSGKSDSGSGITGSNNGGNSDSENNNSGSNSGSNNSGRGSDNKESSSGGHGGGDN